MAPAVASMTTGYDKEPMYVSLLPEAEKLLALAAPPGLAPSDLIPPPGPMEPVPPPKPMLDSAQRQQICYFQNRYQHQRAGENFQPCTAGDGCEFCHAYHPRMNRRSDPKRAACTCGSAQCFASASAWSASGFAKDTSTSADTTDGSSSCSDASAKTPPSDLSVVAQFSPLNDEEGCREAQTEVLISAMPPGLALSDLVLPPGLMEPAPRPKPLSDPAHRRRICYFQNRYHHQRAGDTFFQPCTAGDDCEFCHAFHPRMKRRNDPKTIFCTCLGEKCSGSDNASTATECADDLSTNAETSDASSSCSDSSPKTPAPCNLRVFAKEFVPQDFKEARREAQMAFEKMTKTVETSLNDDSPLDSAAENFLLRKLRAREAQKKFASRLALRA